MNRLSPEAITEELKKLPGWAYDSSLRLHRSFDNFSAAMVFVNRVAELAEEADHHPDIDIRYNQVMLSLTSHDSGGVTSRDIKLAKQISAL